MSEEILRNLEPHLEEVGVEAVWTQWSALGAGTLQDKRKASSIIDPEALLLLSLYLIPAERRLRDLTRWWAHVGSELLSVQRTKTLLKFFPAGVEERLCVYSHWATQAGDKRWKKYAEQPPEDVPDRPRKGPDTPDLHAPAALLLRLRAGFGVSAKADVLAFLLGIGEQTATIKKVVQAVGYSRATVSGALNDLSRASFIETAGTRPAEYHAPFSRWKELLWPPGDDGPDNHYSEGPRWRHWGHLFAFLARAREWGRDANSESAYVASTRARDLFAEFEGALKANRIQVPNPSRFRGPEYLDAFRTTVERTVRWIGEHL